MAQQYSINGSIISPEGGTPAELRIQAFDRDLPSLERLQSAPQLLGEAITDAEGRFNIDFTVERFDSGDSIASFRRSPTKNADISFRVFDRAGQELTIRNIRALGRDFRANQIIFNAPTDLGVEIVVSPRDAGDSEYEKLRALIAPVVANIPLAQLTDEDVAFLSSELGLEQQPETQRQIEWLRRSALLAAETNLPVEAFYGWGRKNLPAAFEELAAGDLNRVGSIGEKTLSQPITLLLSTLQQAIDEKIIPTNFKDQLAEVTTDIERLQVERGSVITRRFIGRLVGEISNEPIAGLAIEGFVPDVAGEPKSVGQNVSDSSGLFAFVYVTPREEGNRESRKLQLQILLDPQTNTKHILEVESGSDHDIVDIRVPVPSEDQPAPQVTELVDTLQLDLPQELRTFLEEQNILSLADIRHVGGLKRHKGMPVLNNNAAVTLLEAHADLNLISADPSVSSQLIARRYDSVRAVAKAPRSDFVNDIHEHVGDFNAAQMHVMATAEMHFLDSIVTGVTVEKANGFEFNALNAEAMEVVERCGCEDCEAAVSPLAYLSDLLNYTVQHVKNGGAAITLNVLAGAFHQPFGSLVATCDAVGTKIRQVRLVVEVLRSYLVDHAPNASQQAALDEAARDYRLAAYTSIAQRLGASYEELRLTQTAEVKERQALAERLGIEEKRLDTVILDPAVLTEAQLEQIFGLIDTTRNPLAAGSTADFLTSRLEFLRTIWKTQDWPAVPVAGSQPLIDPDLIGPGDLKNPVAGDPAFDLWQARVVSLAAQSALIEAEPQTLAGFDSVLTQTLGVPVSDFLNIAGEQAKGNAFSKSLDQLQLSLEEFIYILRIRNLLSSAQPILDAEWESTYAIFIQVFKRKSAVDWRAKENAAGLLLSPDFFQIPPQPVPATSAAIARWRAPRAARIAWQDQLQARMDQQQNVFQALGEAISATEAATLPLLRDALVLATDAPGADLPEKADWVTKNLLIDARMDGCGITTRVAQAIETIQGLLISLRTEQLRDVFLTFKLDAGHFDEEWEWLGSYAPWRSAMFVFMYPENLSNPNLRRWQTPGFKELLRTTQSPRAVSQATACRAARQYSDYFRDICSLRVEASCTSRTRLFQDNDNCKGESGYRCLFYMFGRGISGTVYWSSYDLQSSSGYAQTFWEPVKSHVAGFDNIVEVIGAAPFAISANQRFIFLFARKQQDTLLNIVCAKYDLENQRWIEEVTPFEVPIKVPMAEGSFSVVMKQQDSETEPPHLAVASLLRKVRFDGSGWEDPPFESFGGFIHGMLAAANNAYFVVRTRGEEGRPDDVLVIELVTERPAGRFSFRVSNRLHIISTHLFGPNLKYLGSFTWPDRDYVYVVTAPARHKDRIVGGINLGFLRRARVWRVRDVGGQTLEVKEVASPFGLDEPRIVPTAGVVEDATTKSKRFLYQSDGAPALVDRFLNLSELGDLYPKEPFPAMPSVTGPFEISGQLSTSDLQLRKGLVQKAFSANRTGPASNLAYLEEAYYFVAIQLALGLQRSGEYIAALDWLRTAYDYTAPLAKRKIYDGLIAEESLGDIYKRAPDWLLDPLNPHSIAATRRNTYTRYTLQAIVRCLLDYADAEFTRDTAESNPSARRLYLLALEMLETAELKQHLGDCEQIVGILDNVILGAEWSMNVLSLKSELKAITNTSTLKNIVEEARLALAAEGAPEERFASARQIVSQAVAEIATPTLQTLIDKSSQVNNLLRQPILQDVNVEKAVQRVGKAAADNFQRGLTMVTGLSAASLVSGRKELPWLREAALPAQGIGGASLSAIARLDAARLDVLAPAHISDLAEIAATQPMVAMNVSGAAQPGFFMGAILAFCVPPNPILKALRLRAELNLFKLRTCRNIAGIKRELDPYAAPTDTTTGLPTIGPAGQLNLSGASVIRPSLYTERVLRERAKELVALASQIENEMLVALEKGAMERYAMLKARQDLGLMQAGVRLQGLRITRANHGVKLAELQQERAEIQVKAYEEWIAQGLNAYEQQMVQAYKDIAQYQVDLAEIEANVRLGQALTTAATATFGAVAAAAAAAGVAIAARAAIGATGKLARSQRDAQIASVNASFERRLDEWKLQASIGQQDIKIGEQSVLLANDDVAISQQEVTIAELGVSQARDVIEFLNNKFTNVELYESMSSTLEQIYREFLRQATAVAKVYENQVAFLRQEAPPGFIKSDYWTTPNSDGAGLGQGNGVDRKGLTGSARLLQDIYQLEQYAFDTRKRKLTLTKTISLASLAPAEFQLFRETGVLVFATPMEMFDRDFPGHYLRIINRVRTSVIALIPPIQGIHATLSTSGLSRVVIGPDVFQTVPIRRDPELVALSTPTSATGVLEMESQQSEMLFPFEGCGADATWELRMPKAANQIDYRSIADVLVTIEYSALNSFDYRDQVTQAMKPVLSGDLALSFRHHLPDQWYDLNNPDQTATPMSVQFSIDRQDLPPNLEALKIQQLLIYFSRKDGKSFEVAVSQLRFTAQGGVGPVGGGATSIDGAISTRRGNGAAWSAAFVGKVPLGDWELVLPNTEEIRNRFRDDDIDDILFVITYAGRTPDWPS